MRESTIAALDQLNQRFYEAVAGEFHDSRKAPWPGFSRVLSALPTAPTTVLDVGCGDGRFAAFLQDELTSPFEYTGVDSSQALLAIAKARALPPRCRFVQSNVLQRSFRPDRRFSLIVLFGLLHHVPSLALRKELLAKLAAHTEPGGWLVMTFWRLHDDPRFERRVFPLSAYNASAEHPIPPEDLESGDTLLRWGDGDAPPRYCHFADDAEVQALCDATGLQRAASFRSDGRGDTLNEYVVLRAPT